MFIMPTAYELQTESDVEQKLIFPLLTAMPPYGMGIPSPQILTKLDVRKLDIGKGQEKKRYFPDYIILADRLPMAVVEAKKPGDDLGEGFREARLYAQEINARFPSNFNPVLTVVCCNGLELAYGPPDAATPNILTIRELNPSYEAFERLQQSLSWTVLNNCASRLNSTLKPPRYWKPKKLLGGAGVQTEEVGHNTFGSTLSAELGYIFTPENTADRAEIAKHAYVDSRAAQRAIDPIDKIIRAAKPISETSATLINSSVHPTELVEKLRTGPRLEGKVILLVGSVGSGKSTFVDHLIHKALPRDVIGATLWCRVNMNNAPASKDEIYKWLRARIAEGCVANYPDEDFESLEITKKVYAVEVNRFEKVQGRILKESGDLVEYGRRLTAEVDKWQADPEITSKAIARYCCGDRGRLLVIVLDNCDKRSRDEQLLMFQAAHWIQNEYRSLIILPLREETYEAHQGEKPLDTAYKDMIFRIEPPLFQHVLVKRAQLALSKMKPNEGKMLSYELPNGFTVTYPQTDQAFYLSSIIRSLFEHDRFIRRMITGLSGKNIRKALEIFMDFCNSAHLGEDEIFKIRQSEGKYTLPLFLVTRILLRGNLRYYDESASAVKNLFNIFHTDSAPFYFSRLAILRWLNKRFNQTGPNGVRGYFKVADMRADLLKIGVPAYAFEREIDNLIKAQCITSENLTLDKVTDEDLVRLNSAGYVHLDLLTSVDYLATIAEDTWLDNWDLAKRISERIGRSESHLQLTTQILNAKDFTQYLKEKQELALKAIASYQEDDPAGMELLDISKAIEAVQSLAHSTHLDEWLVLKEKYPDGSIHLKKISNRTFKHGVFVEMEVGVNGLIYKPELPTDYMTNDQYFPNEEIRIRVKYIDPQKKRISLIPLDV